VETLINLFWFLLVLTFCAAPIIGAALLAKWLDNYKTERARMGRFIERVMKITVLYVVLPCLGLCAVTALLVFAWHWVILGVCFMLLMWVVEQTIADGVRKGMRS